MNKFYKIISFFSYYKTEEKTGEKTLVNMSRFIKGRDGKKDIIQILYPSEKRSTIPKMVDGTRCLVSQICERFTPDGKMIEDYEFHAIVPDTAKFVWDSYRENWSYTVNVGMYTLVYIPKNGSEKLLPKPGSGIEAKWKVKPYRVKYSSKDGKFLIVLCELEQKLNFQRYDRAPSQNHSNKQFKNTNFHEMGGIAELIDKTIA